MQLSILSILKNFERTKINDRCFKRELKNFLELVYKVAYQANYHKIRIYDLNETIRYLNILSNCTFRSVEKILANKNDIITFFKKNFNRINSKMNKFGLNLNINY